MKRNDINDLKSKTEDELKKMLFDLRSEITKSSTDKYLGKLKNTNFAKWKKKDIARVLTFLHMKAASVPLSGITASQGEVK